MARRRRGRPVHGWLVLDKPVGLTSTQAMARARRLLDAQKAGHAGTLDPMASGLLPIAFGEATKTVSHVMDGTKTYVFAARFGEARDTDDREGEVIETSDVRPTDARIRAALPAFTGRLMQTPPLYSAIKIDGERAYARARAGAGELPPAREVEILELSLTGRPDPDHAVFAMRCGKGTYVRSLVRDLARALGTVAHVAELRRTAVGPFAEKDAISLEKLEALGHNSAPQDVLLPVATALDDIPALALTETQADYLRHGRAVRARSGGMTFVDPNDLNALCDGSLLCAMSGQTPVALARLEGEEIRPVRVLNL